MTQYSIRLILVACCFILDVRGDDIHINLDPNLACSVDGKLIPNGQNFTTKQNGPCFTFKCVNRAFVPIEYKCPYLDTCLAVGKNITTNQCIVQQCTQSGSYVSYEIVKDGCAKFNGECLDVNGSYKDGCTTYTCLKTDNLYHLAITEWGCSYGDKCYKPNEVVKSGCMEKRCEKRDQMVGMFPVKQGCQFINGTCLDVGEMGIDRCSLYECQAKNFNGMTMFSTVPKGAMCQDYKGACHNNGAVMEIEFKDQKTIVNCTCTIDGMNVGYQCLPH